MSDELCEDAFLEGAMERYGDAVYRLALCRLGSRADAEDVYQDVFLRLLRDTTAFRDGEHLKAWLLRVTLHCCVDLRRSGRRSKRCRPICVPPCGCTMSRATARTRSRKS